MAQKVTILILLVFCEGALVASPAFFANPGIKPSFLPFFRKLQPLQETSGTTSCLYHADFIEFTRQRRFRKSFRTPVRRI